MIRIIMNVNIQFAGLRSLNLNLLPVLDAVLAERSVTRAARRLGMTQPAVSNALAQLRVLLEDPLLVRSGNRMLPTERALALAGPVREALAALASAMMPAAGFEPKTAERRFVIGTTDYVEFVLLPRLVARLRREAPSVTLRVVSWPLHRVAPALAAGEMDLMIGYYESVPQNHREQLLFSDEFVCILKKGHRALRKKLTVERYAALSHVLVSEEDGPGVVDLALAKCGLRRHVALRMSHFLMVPAVIATSDLVAAVDRRVAEPFARRLPLVLVPPPLALPAGRVGQVWHERTHASPPHAWLRSKVAEASRSL